MQLSVLGAPERGPGCVARRTHSVDLGDGLGRVELLVSSCQMQKYTSGIGARVAAERLRSKDPEMIQQALQSWIDGDSPCDAKFARPEDRGSDDDEDDHDGPISPEEEMAVLMVVFGVPSPEEVEALHKKARRRAFLGFFALLVWAAVVVGGLVLITIRAKSGG